MKLRISFFFFRLQELHYKHIIDMGITIKRGEKQKRYSINSIEKERHGGDVEIFLGSRKKAENRNVKGIKRNN